MTEIKHVALLACVHFAEAEAVVHRFVIEAETEAEIWAAKQAYRAEMMARGATKVAILAAPANGGDVRDQYINGLKVSGMLFMEVNFLLERDDTLAQRAA